MAKLTGAALDRWVASPDKNHRAVLFYGPNEGLVRERARSVVTHFSGGKLDDPFSVTVCDQAARSANPAMLSDEVFSFSMFGGDKVVWVREAADALTDTLAAVLSADKAGNFVVVEAGDLTPRSKLRVLFEKSDEAVAAGCYLDDERGIAQLAGSKFRAAGIRIDRDALELLVSRLGQDRLANIAEIDKLCLLAGDGGELSAETIVTAIGDGMGDMLDECIFSLFDGRRAEADRLVARVFDDGVAPPQLARRLLSHVDRLITVRVRVDGGEPAKAAMGRLQPRVFFKFEGRFMQQISNWSMADLLRVQDALVRLEIECKSTGLPHAALCQRMALSVSGAAGRRGR